MKQPRDAVRCIARRHKSPARLRRSGGIYPSLPVPTGPLVCDSEVCWRRWRWFSGNRTRQQVQRAGCCADLAGRDAQVLAVVARLGQLLWLLGKRDIFSKAPFLFERNPVKETEAPQQPYGLS